MARTASSPVLAAVGDSRIASAVARRAARHVPAYARLLAARGCSADAFADLPIVDKAGYILAHPLSDLVGDDFAESFAVIASSGSSGHAAYWPLLRGGQAEQAAALLRYMEGAFRIHEQRTLAIVGLALGSWIGGDLFSWAIKNAAAAAPYPFATIATGNRHDEILRVIGDAAGWVDQVLLIVCPSAIGHLHLLGESRPGAFPHGRMRYIVIGEPFPESLRSALRLRAGLAEDVCPLLSIYGSADTGLLGAESPHSAAARSLMAQSPELARALGLPGPAPHLFHIAAPDAYLETIGGELIVTRWQGVPLVRYNLHDAASLVPWAGLRTALLEASGPGTPGRAVLEAAPRDLPDVIALAGRADRCLILCGTNLSEAMLDEAVASLAMPDVFTGIYRASIAYDRGRQFLRVELESRDRPTAAHDAAVYARLVEALGRVQPEFLDDWRNVYRVWDGDVERRIIRLSYPAWPTLSHATTGPIKARGGIA